MAATLLKPSYLASSALTVTNLASLAQDTNLLAGWSSAVQANGTTLAVSDTLTALLKTGATSTSGTIIQVYLWAALDDTPTYPDTITGSEGAKTLTNTGIRDGGAFKLAGTITVSGTANIVYPFHTEVSQWFGGHMPKNWGAWIVHNTGGNLNATQVVSRGDPKQYTNI